MLYGYMTVATPTIIHNCAYTQLNVLPYIMFCCTTRSYVTSNVQQCVPCTYYNTWLFAIEQNGFRARTIKLQTGPRSVLQIAIPSSNCISKWYDDLCNARAPIIVGLHCVDWSSSMHEGTKFFMYWCEVLGCMPLWQTEALLLVFWIVFPRCFIQGDELKPIVVCNQLLN